MGSGVENIERATPDVAGQDVTHRFTDGAAHVAVSPISLINYETRFGMIDGGGESVTWTPAGDLTVGTANLITFDTFLNSPKNCRIEYLKKESSNVNARAAFVLGVLNSASDAAAAASLSIVNVGPNETGSTDEQCRAISRYNPVMEWNGSTIITRVDVAGIVMEAAGDAYGNVLIAVTLW